MKLFRRSHVDFFSGTIVVNMTLFVKYSDGSSYVFVRYLLLVEFSSDLSESYGTLVSLHRILELSDSSEHHGPLFFFDRIL